MPYENLEQVPAQVKTHKDCPLSLEQANYWAKIFDAIGKDEPDPAAIAWAQFEKLYEIKNSKWEKKPAENQAFADLDDTGNLAEVEVMGTGTWKGWTFSESDLDNIVANFSRLPLRVALKIGHGKQEMAQREGLPAVGWVKELKRVGKKLVASFSDIPKKLVELIKRKNYIRFSSEVRRNFNFNGNTYGNVLSAVALLGEELPAVQTLDDIYNLHAANAAAFSSAWPDGQVIFTNDSEGGSKMGEVEILKSELEKKDQEIALREQKIAELQLREKTFSDDAKRKEIYAVIDAGIGKLKIAPAAREIFAALAFKADGLVETEHKFSENGKDVVLSVQNTAELIKKFSEVMPEVLPAKEKVSGGSAEEQIAEEEVRVGTRVFKTDEELHGKITKLMEEKKDLSYSEAFEIVADKIATEARNQEVD